MGELTFGGGGVKMVGGRSLLGGIFPGGREWAKFSAGGGDSRRENPADCNTTKTNSLPDYNDMLN